MKVERTSAYVNDRGILIAEDAVLDHNMPPPHYDFLIKVSRHCSAP